MSAVNKGLLGEYVYKLIQVISLKILTENKADINLMYLVCLASFTIVDI